MFKNILLLFLTVFLLSSCAYSPTGYLKRSANNKLFDLKGFKGGKRTPLYNKKYIEKAKKNIASGNLEEEEDEVAEDDYGYPYENYDPVKRNRAMYREMLEEERESLRNEERKGRNNRPARYDSSGYPKLSFADKQALASRRYEDSQELREELEMIKDELDKTRAEIYSYKCPTAERNEQEFKNSKKAEREILSKHVKDSNSPDEADANSSAKKIVTASPGHLTPSAAGAQSTKGVPAQVDKDARPLVSPQSEFIEPVKAI